MVLEGNSTWKRSKSSNDGSSENYSSDAADSPRKALRRSQSSGSTGALTAPTERATKRSPRRPAERKRSSRTARSRSRSKSRKPVGRTQSSRTRSRSKSRKPVERTRSSGTRSKSKTRKPVGRTRSSRTRSRSKSRKPVERTPSSRTRSKSPRKSTLDRTRSSSTKSSRKTRSRSKSRTPVGRTRSSRTRSKSPGKPMLERTRSSSTKSSKRMRSKSPRKPMLERTRSSSTKSSRSRGKSPRKSGRSKSPGTLFRRRSSSGSSSSSSNSSLTSRDDTIDTKGLSVVRTLTLLRSQPANRSCVDCRSALLDPSSVYASICLATPTGTKNVEQNQENNNRKIALQDFRLNHRAFAPPDGTGNSETKDNRSDSKNSDKIVGNGHQKRNNEYEDDPAFSANRRFGGHGVFICKKCAEAHRELGPSVIVKRVKDLALFTAEEVQFMVTNGGNAQCWKIYEGFVPHQWKERRPIYSSSLSSRILFCRAKYEALAFCFPPPGPIAGKAWENIIRKQQGRKIDAPGTANLKNITSLSVSNYSLNVEPPSNKGKKRGLPNRLVDYFCVVTSSMQLLPSKPSRTRKENKVQYSDITSPEALDFWPHVTDCYPPQNTHGEMGYENHISSFVMPGGCHPTRDPKPPSFSTFVLTMADGSFVYGASLQVYDEHVDSEEMKTAMLDSGYEGEFPSFLTNSGQRTNNDSDVFFFPKCLVFLSRYAFYDLFRSVLLEIYQISLVAAPLPIERYISNFVCEVPLPPQGKVRVDFSFTADRKFSIERPPINRLPMANFSYRPLFTCLSVSNILVVLGYLLQEFKVVLLSKHYSLLTPVAEALLSAIFPFRWVGLYIPVAPLKMTDILDAPIPYLIGLNSEYLNIVSINFRPKDAILVDLDKDVIHIGDLSLPMIPEGDAQKLMTSLEEAGGSVYAIPNSGIKGCIMSGSTTSVLVQNERRPRYAHMTTMAGMGADSLFRNELFSMCDLAYGKNDDEAGRIIDFRTMNGQLIAIEQMQGKEEIKEKKKTKPSMVKPVKRPNAGRNKKTILSRNQMAVRQAHLLDMTEPEGFSVAGIRNAFLRFTVATFADYQDSLLDNSGSDLFDEEKFVEDARSRDGSKKFLKNVLITQLFQRFLEERKENPDLPEIRFFDESITAKRNRSKRETFAKGGKKKPTPFLDDRTTWDVKKIFSPNPPNNLGLPDEEDAYRYGVFPILDPRLFGRIRPPVKWRQHTSLNSVINTKASTSKMKRSNNEAFKNALKPVLANQSTIAAVAKRSARDLESTLTALSFVPDSKNRGVASKGIIGEKKKLSARGSVKIMSTADTIMMDARRKQSILLDFVIQMQALCRGFLARQLFARNKLDILESRRNKEKAKWESNQRVQRRREEKRRRMRSQKIIVIQKFARMWLARKKKERMLSAITLIQSMQRSSKERKQLKLIKDSSIVISNFVRGRRAQMIFHEIRRVVIIVQSRMRGALVRSKMKVIKEQKIDLYTTQIFILWTSLHVPLIFRAKLWPDISARNSFLCLSIAEEELLRLWNMAGLSDRWNNNVCPDKISLYCDSIGISNDIYFKSKKCADFIQSGGQIGSGIGEALQREETERLQIYERLNSSILEKDMSTLYRNFDIAPGEKLKKIALSEVIWTKIVLADRSAASMNFMFPELKNSLGISFVNPSSKGCRRFPKALKSPVPPIDPGLWKDISAEGKTKRHVQEAAMLFITKVPKISGKLDSMSACSRNSTEKFDSLVRAVMKANGIQDIEKARRFVLQRYIRNT